MSETFDEGAFNIIKAVLKDLTIGRYPRVGHIPLLLKLHQERFAEAGEDGNRIHVYFHPSILKVNPLSDYTEAAQKVPYLLPQPEVNISEHVRQDLQLKWRVLRKTYRSASDEQPAASAARYGVYRFLFFIHAHPIRHPYYPYQQHAVYTISVWDREWDELIWHDAYPYERKERRAAIHQFWTQATTNFLPAHLSNSELGRNTVDPRQPGTMRFNTTYHAFEEPAGYPPPPPRDTLLFVLAMAVYHVNEATYDDQVVLPKTDEHIWGHRTELIPRLVFGGLMICLESEHLREDDAVAVRDFFYKVSVAESLEWLREGLRYYIDKAGWSPEIVRALRLEVPQNDLSE
ncbi:hypothetical protein PG990_011479 [Apiospora arundinis]